MSDYIKFWLAKELVQMWPLLLIVGGIGLLVLCCYVWDKAQRVWRRWTR